MVDVTTDIVIDRPGEEVAAYAGDPSNAPEWYVNIDLVGWESEPVVDPRRLSRDRIRRR